MNNENLKKIIKLRHYLHENPELSGHEVYTKNYLMDFINNNTSFAVVDCGNYFYAAKYFEGSKAVGFRADFDALPINEDLNLIYASKNPGISHKCGHDGHSAILCGLALELDNLKLKNSVYLIFQHSEEDGKGALECSKILRERNIKKIYALHNWSGWDENNIILKSGIVQCPSEGLTVKFIGENSHASEPEKGIDPSFAISELILNLINYNNFQRDKILCTVININLGDNKNFGISPGFGEVSFTIRAERENILHELEIKIKELAMNLARENNLNIEFEILDKFPETVNDPGCVNDIKRAAENLKLKIIEMQKPLLASEDFGYYTKEIPGAIFYIGNGKNYPAIHSAGYDFNDNIINNAVNIFVNLYENF